MILTKMPPSLSNIQCLGAFSLFICFLGPRTILTRASLAGHGSKDVELLPPKRGRCVGEPELCAAPKAVLLSPGKTVVMDAAKLEDAVAAWNVPLHTPFGGVSESETF